MTSGIILSVSPGNTKTGPSIPSVSLPPGETCTAAARRTCYAGGCYAAKLQRIYPNVRASWARNLELWRTDPESFESQLAEYLRKRQPRCFRWHVGGDIPDAGYFSMMKRIAGEFPRTRFLAFTKRRILLNPVERNLRIVQSQWPGIPVYGGSAMAWLEEDRRRPSDAVECPGNCESCGMCWSLSGHVYFHKH